MSLKTDSVIITVDDTSGIAFKKRRCVKFIPMKDDKKNVTNICMGCKEDRDQDTHHEDSNSDEWSIACTLQEKTDAFGELKFSSSFTNKAKYMRIDTKTNAKEFLKYMHKEWELDAPNLIISITGGARDFTINEGTKKAFKKGLIKAAKTTDAWIVTGGTNFGCMRLAGDAIMDDLNSSQLTMLGIATWGVVAFRDTLIRNDQLKIDNGEENTLLDDDEFYVVEYEPEKKIDKTNLKNIEDSALNPHHSHFILVDDGSNAKFGVEIDFRTKLENSIRTENGANIPMVMIVLEGGIGTLETAYGALKIKVPVILVEGTGKSADLIIEAQANKDKKDDEEYLEKLINEKHKLALKGSKLKDAKVYLKEFMEDVNDKYINKMSKNCIDLETVILKALSEIDLNFVDRLSLAIKWNQLKDAKKIIEGTKNKKKEDFNTLLEIALIENKPKFANLFLENGASMKEFLTVQKLQQLYLNSRMKKNRVKEPILAYLKIHKKSFKLEEIGKFLKHLFDKSKIDFIPTDADDENSAQTRTLFWVQEPEFNLFLWALLTNRIEIAKIFWRLGKNQISNALIASKIYRYFSKNQIDGSNQFKEISEEFEKLAIGVIDMFDQINRDVINDVLILRYIDYLSMDCLELAVHCRCEAFVSKPIVQNVLNALWQGKIQNEKDFEPLEKQLKECQKKHNSVNNDYALQKYTNDSVGSSDSLFGRIIDFYSVPINRYYTNFAFYHFFLILFSYSMIFEYSSSYDNDNSTRTLFETEAEPIRPKWFEFVVLVWVLGLFSEEIQQFCQYKQNLFLNWKRYRKNEWNLLDLIGCVLYFIGFILKMCSTNNEQSVFIWSRIIMSIDLAIWYIRSLHFFLVSWKLGPKLLMIRKMMEDLFYFFVVITNFVFAFGLAVHAISFPKKEFTFEVFINVFNIAYWPIYGEIKILDMLEECHSDELCDTTSVIVSFLIVMFYMALSSILLINILIAIFSNTFDDIQKNSDIVWRNQRYELIREYIEYSPVPSPFNIIYNIKKLFNKKANAENKDISVIKSDVLTDYEQKCTEKFLRELNEQNSSFKNHDENILKSLKEIVKKAEDDTN